MLELSHLLAALWIGLQVTLKVTAGAILLGMVLSTVFGVALIQRAVWFRMLARVYVEVFRGTSAIVQLF